MIFGVGHKCEYSAAHADRDDPTCGGKGGRPWTGTKDQESVHFDPDQNMINAVASISQRYPPE
jgi:hypothetical protein